MQNTVHADAVDAASPVAHGARRLPADDLARRLRLSGPMRSLLDDMICAGGVVRETPANTQDALVRRDLAFFGQNALRGWLCLTADALPLLAITAEEPLDRLVGKIATLNRFVGASMESALAMASVHPDGASVVRNVYARAHSLTGRAGTHRTGKAPGPSSGTVSA